MSEQPLSYSTSRSTRGGTAARVLLIILGVFLTLCGFIFSIACIALILEEDTAGIIVLPFAAGSFIGGIALIITQARKKSSPSYAADLDSSETVVSVQPLTGGPSSTVPVMGTEHQRAAQPSSSAAEDVASLVSRSSDLFASLRDLVRHESHAGSNKYHLATMLEAAGVMQWPDAPACEGGRLSRNRHFWIRLNTDDLTAEQYDLLIATEAALSVNQDLPDAQGYALDSRQALDATGTLMRNLATLEVGESSLTDEGIRACYRDTPANQTPGEWLLRSKIAHAAESISTPFRVTFTLRANLEEGLVVLALEVPRPGCMAIFTPDTAAQAGYARAYALRLATLMARHAFAASDRVTRVVINCIEHDQTDTLLSIDFSEKILTSLLKVAQSTQVEQGFPASENIRASFAQGWFEPVEPFVALNSPLAVPTQACTYPELDNRPAAPAVERTCGAHRISDLGINENAVRIAAWDQLSAHLPQTTEQAVQELVSLRDSAEDITVMEACGRTMQALVDGKVDLDDRNALAGLFIDGSSLDRAVQRANELLNEDGKEDPDAAYQILAQALAPIDDMGAYLDDESTAYRYFGSVCERIVHNLTIDEHGRQIRLVPDAYFNAHANASVALGMLGRNDEALEHADICMRLAPTSTYAALRKVRILEAQSRIYEAADLIVKALRTAATAHDVAVCHYRLAFMEWKLGREDLAAACYVRSLTWNTDVVPQAREELDDLVSAIDGLERPTPEQADSLLAREGIPLGCVKTDLDRMLAAGVACMDDHAFYTARGLMAALFAMNSDDVIMGVYRSLAIDIER